MKNYFQLINCFFGLDIIVRFNLNNYILIPTPAPICGGPVELVLSADDAVPLRRESQMQTTKLTNGCNHLVIQWLLKIGYSFF